MRRNDSDPFLLVAGAADLCLKRGMNVAALSAENARLKALLAQTQAALADHQAALAQAEEARRRLEVIVGELRRDKFGAKSEKLSADQQNLPFEDVERSSTRRGRGRKAAA
jgi:hypothetical protein